MKATLFLLTVLFSTPAFASDSACGPQMIQIPAYRLHLQPMKTGKPYPGLIQITDEQTVIGDTYERGEAAYELPECRLQSPYGPLKSWASTYGELKSWAYVSQKLIAVTKHGYVLTLPRRADGSFDCEHPQSKRVSELIASQVLADGRIVWKSMRTGGAVVTQADGSSLVSLDDRLQDAQFVDGIEGEVSPEHYRAAVKGDTLFILDKGLKVLRKNRMDRPRVVIASGESWFAAYSQEVGNILVYGLKGEILSSSDLPHKQKDRYRISTAGRGGPILVYDTYEQETHVIDPQSGIETDVARPARGAQWALFRQPYAFLGSGTISPLTVLSEYKEKRTPLPPGFELFVKQDGFDQRFVEVPCDSLEAESRDGGESVSTSEKAK